MPSILRDISTEGADYQGQIIHLLGLENPNLNDQETEHDLQRWVLRMIVSAPAGDLQKGISLKRLRSLIAQNHPKSYRPTEGQIERIVREIQSVQLAKAGQSLLDYDRQDKIVRCVDKGMILWRASTSLDRIRDLFEEQD